MESSMKRRRFLSLLAKTPRALLWTLGGKVNQLMEHQAGKGHQVKTCHRFGQPFIVPGQSPKPAGPRKAAFDDPASGQQDEARAWRRAASPPPARCRGRQRPQSAPRRCPRSTKARVTRSPVASRIALPPGASTTARSWRWPASRAGPAGTRVCPPPDAPSIHSCACPHHSPPDARFPGCSGACGSRGSWPWAHRPVPAASAAAPADRAPCSRTPPRQSSASFAGRPPPTAGSWSGDSAMGLRPHDPA